MIKAVKFLNTNLIDKGGNMIKYSSLVLAVLLLSSGCGGGGSGGDSSSSSSSSSNAGVLINEVLADNNSTNRDPDLGNYGDWVELKNMTSNAVDISGYGLSDSDKKIKWNFPNGTTIAPSSLLIVWADDFNTTLNPNPTALHTTFKLKSNKDKVVLFDKSGNILDELRLKDYKVTQSDVSIARTSSGEFILSNPPTPGSENSSNGFSLSEKPEFSLEEGVYSNPVEVTITAQNGSEIYYTTDGTDATTSSPNHSNSSVTVNLTANKTTLKAISKDPGNDKLVSKENSKTFVIAPPHDVVINEIFADNNSSDLSSEYKTSDWVELYNSSDMEVDISNYRISDSKKLLNSNWKFPAGTTIPANGYLVVFADKRTALDLHTDFKLSSKDDSVVLYNDNGEIIDFKDFKDLKGVSLSRQGVNNFTETKIQTPGAINSK